MNEKAEYRCLFLVKCPKEEVHRYSENYELSSPTITKIIMKKQLNTYEFEIFLPQIVTTKIFVQ